MPNTTVTLTYENGATREFIASDELEKLINEGEMFSVTTMHSDMSIDEELALSKMYVGNPMAALGNMIIMRSNAEKLLDEGDEDMTIAIGTLNACIKLLSDEITSHQSGMSPVEYKPEGRQFRKNEPLVPIDMTQMGDDEPEVETFYCGHDDTVNNACRHSCNLDKPCIKDYECKGFIAF